MKRHLVLGALALATAATVLTGCAKERDPINRVQPYALDKSLFVGDDLADDSDNPEFWTQATLIDVPYGASQGGLFQSTFTQQLSRIRWQITEEYLLGRLAYERIADSDGEGAGMATNDGIIVVAFRIEKHFDIVRAYNPTTGEELNIYEENSTDRPWNERQYMRVDWSKNENTDAYDFDTLSMLGVFYSIDYEPMAYDVTDPMSPHAPVFDLENGYFDVTNKAFAKPGLIDLSHLGWGIDAFPACMLPKEFSGGTEPVATCNPVELTIRQSFRRVEDTDFEPKHWDGYRFQAAGGFYTTRFGYARNYGMSDDKWYRFLNHYQIWNRSHYYQDEEAMTGHTECFTPETTPYDADPHRDDNNDGTEDECESVGPGSKCDTFRQRCTLPYGERTLRTIPWYYTQGESHEFFEPTAMATHEWDVALRVAARAAQYAECQATGGTNCAVDFPMYHGQADHNRDAIDLAREIDDCRTGRAYQGRDCMALADQIGQQRGYDPAVVSISKMEEIIVLCHSPVEQGDHPACGEQRLPVDLTAAACAQARADGDRDTQATCAEALNVRQGDLRYHKVNVFYDPASPSPWGIYSDAEDPLTGQTISASVNVWGWVNDYYSQYYVDVLRYMKGELATEDVTDGEYVRKWVQAQEAAARGGALPRVSKAQIRERIASFAGVAESQLPDANSMPDNAFTREVAAVKQKLTGYRFDAKEMSSYRAQYAARQQAARGTSFEADLMTPMVEDLMGVSAMPLTDGVMNHASLLRRGNPSFQRDYKRMYQNALAERGICVMHGDKAAAPLSLGGLADKLEAKFGNFNPSDPVDVQVERAERMRRYLARRMHFSVIAHEMGHSVGMRHNFVSSSDAWQFRPQYWQLRTKNGTVNTECTDQVSDGANCVGPRWFDPVTDEERDNMIWMFMHSSVMDYAGEITQDMMGLGVYDFAAVRMYYGDVTSVGMDPQWGLSGAYRESMLGKMDNFGGILGIQWSDEDGDFHYSQLQRKLNLVRNCYTVADPELYKPASWDEEVDGLWNPTLDGMLVQVNGQWTRCEQPQVDYVPWTRLRTPTSSEMTGYYRGGPSIDTQGRIRMPYGFGTDRWADLGNVSVYRHDNGADPYEIFNFLITQQEVGHIFDNYRRGRQTFSVRSQANRTLSRYNEKVRDGAKGLGLMRNIYEEIAINNGWDFQSYWPFIATYFFGDNILASGMVFDHFTRTLARPEVGGHYLPQGDSVLRSELDDFGTGGTTEVTIPNGATGYYESVSYGGKLVENQLADGEGEYDSEYTINCGSYYDKLNAAYLMTESVDNFISDSRLDFVDPRYRAVSLADLFPEGYRRWIGNNLTDDDRLKGPHVAANASGQVLRDDDGYPAQGIGWTSWWADDPYVCFPGEGTQVCGSYGAGGNTPFNPASPANTVVVDPQVGWEQQKFLIAWTLLYLPENERYEWLNMMDIWELGRDADPEFANRIEFHHPDGKVFVAKTYGKEVLFGKTVERGIAARVLQQANDYLQKAYEVTDGPDLDGDGVPEWYLPVVNPTTGAVVVKFDPNVLSVDSNGMLVSGYPGCDANDSSLCTCSANSACLKLKNYVSVPTYLREALSAYALGHPSERGLY